jgi:hypothetical protein
MDAALEKINDNWLIFLFFFLFAFCQPGVVVVLQTVALKSMVRFVVDCCFDKHNHVHATHGSLGKGHDTAGYIHFEVIMVTNSAKIRKLTLASSIPLKLNTVRRSSISLPQGTNFETPPEFRSQFR